MKKQKKRKMINQGRQPADGLPDAAMQLAEENLHQNRRQQKVAGILPLQRNHQVNVLLQLQRKNQPVLADQNQEAVNPAVHADDNFFSDTHYNSIHSVSTEWIFFASGKMVGEELFYFVAGKKNRLIIYGDLHLRTVDCIRAADCTQHGDFKIAMGLVPLEKPIPLNFFFGFLYDCFCASFYRDRKTAFRHIINL